jgi:protein SCO1
MLMKKVWLYMLVALLLLGAGFAAYRVGRSLRPKVVSNDSELQGTAWQNPPSVAEISLTRAGGSSFSFKDLQSDVNVVFFGFTRCPDICPFTMARLKEIYLNLQEPESLEVIMITVDPEHDTPEVTQNYIGNFHPNFIGLSGDNTQVAKAIQTFYVAGQEAEEGSFVHTDAVLILDREARLRYVYGQSSLVHLESDLRKLLGEW